MPGLCEHAEKTQGIVRKSRQVLDFGLVTRHEVAESEMDIECGKQEISVSSEKMTNIPYLNCVPIDDRKECEKGMGKYNEIYLRPAAMNTVEEEGKIWFALLNRNGICEIDRATWQAKICKIFEEEPLNRSFLYSHIEKMDNNLIFAPGMASKIAFYDLKNGSMTYIPLKALRDNPKENQKEIKFWNTFKYQSYVYLFGYSYPAIIRIDMRSMEIQYFTDWLADVEENIDFGDVNGYFTDGYVIIGDLALIPVGCRRAILELNLRTGHTKIRKLKVSMEGIGGLASINGEDIWLVGRGSKTNWISCWNRRTGHIKEYLLADVEENLMDPFYAPICTNNQVFLMPMSGPCIYEININTGKVDKSNILKREFKNSGIPLAWWKTMASKLDGDWLVFMTCDDTKWQEYNVVTGEIKSYFIRFEDGFEEIEPYFEAVYKELNKKREVIPETKLSLRYFIDNNSHLSAINLYKKNQEYLVGANVYQIID